MVTVVRQIRTKLNDRPLPYQANSSAFQCFCSLCIANFFRCSSYIHTHQECFLQWDLNPRLWIAESFTLQPKEEWWKLIYISIKQRQLTTKDMQPVQKTNCIAKPGIERLLFLAVAFEPATMDSRELYSTVQLKEEWWKLIYIHRTKATSYIRHATSSKKQVHDQTWNRTPIVSCSGIWTSNCGCRELFATTDWRVVKVDICIHRTKT